MKRCGVCGKEFAAEARFCSEDGTPLSEDNPPPGGPEASAFEALARNSRLSNGARAELDVLWSATYRLASWLFLARGDSMLPIVCPIDGRSSVMAFTDHYAAQRFAKLQQYGPDDDIATMVLSIEGASEMMLGLRARGVETLLFNHGGEGYSLPLANLPGLYHYFKGRELPCVERATLRTDEPV